MSDFTYQEGTALTWAQMNENLRLMQAKYLDSANSAAIAVAAANFKGNWSALTGALAVPASVYHSSKFWLLLSNLADVTAKVPGVDAEWLEIITGNVMGPASATDNALVRFDGATGKLVQNSAATLSDAGELALPANGLTVGGTQLAVSAGVANFGVRSSWSLGAVTSAAISVNVAGTGSGRTLIDLTNTDTSTSTAVLVALKSGATSAALSLVKYGTEYTVVPQYAGMGLLTDAGTAGVGIAAGDAAGGIKFMTGASPVAKFQITAAGNVLVTGAGGLGYGAGAGGTVTQATSKSTAVTLNKTTGLITTHNAALAAGASVTFSVNCSSLEAPDVPVVAAAGNGNYRVEAYVASPGVFAVRITNVTAGSLSEAVPINFCIVKGVRS